MSLCMCVSALYWKTGINTNVQYKCALYNQIKQVSGKKKKPTADYLSVSNLRNDIMWSMCVCVDACVSVSVQPHM